MTLLLLFHANRSTFRFISIQFQFDYLSFICPDREKNLSLFAKLNLRAVWIELLLKIMQTNRLMPFFPSTNNYYGRSHNWNDGINVYWNELCKSTCTPKLNLNGSHDWLDQRPAIEIDSYTIQNGHMIHSDLIDDDDASNVAVSKLLV